MAKKSRCVKLTVVALTFCVALYLYITFGSSKQTINTPSCWFFPFLFLCEGGVKKLYQIINSYLPFGGKY